MPVVSVGDMAQQFISMRSGGAIKSELSHLAESLSTGQVTDITRHLNGETTRFAGINHSLSQLDAYGQAANEAQQGLTGMQTVLGRVDNLRAETSAQLLLVGGTSTSAQIDEAARAARGTFDTMVNALNTRVADRSLMGGADVTSAPLAAADDMIADLQTAIGGATDQASITAAINTWFDDPAGGFATMGYQGDTGPAPEKRVSEDKSLTIDARADDPAIRDTLKAAAFAALAHELSGLDTNTKSSLLREAGTGLFAAASGLVGLQSRVGDMQASVEQTTTGINAQRTTLEIAKNDLISADPFDTASKLQSVQLQLETHYSVTARLSQLSLLGYI